MTNTLFQALAVASIGIISPGSITMVILLLMSDKGWRNGIAFTSSYLVMYTLIGATFLTLGVSVADNAESEQSLTTSLILVGLSAVFFALSFRNWRKPPESDQSDNQTSRFTTIVNGITPLKSAALAATISLVNFKNLTIYLSAVSILLLSDLKLVTKLTMLMPVVLLFCTSVIVPVTIYWLFPDQASDYLTRIKDTISRYSRPLGITITLILGCLFLYRGLTGLL